MRYLFVAEKLKRLWHCPLGVTSIEYALIAALISMATIGAATEIGGRLDITFTNVAAGFGNHTIVSDEPENSASTPSNPLVQEVASLPDDQPSAAEQPDNQADKANTKSEKAADKAPQKRRREKSSFL